MFRFRFLLVLICTLLVTNVAYSAFKTSRIGGSKGLVVTPVADLLTQLQEVLNDPNQELTSQQLEDLNINVNAFGGYPLDRHELLYMQNLLANLNFGSSQSSFQSLFDQTLTDNATSCPGGNCALGAADWIHEGVNSDTSSPFFGDRGRVTAEVIDDLINEDGYTEALLSAGGVSFDDVIDVSSIFWSISNDPGRATRPDVTRVRNAIHEISGFVGVFADDPLNPDPQDYTDANGLVDEFLDNNDYGSFTLANFYSCYQNNESRSGGDEACTVSASEWDNQLTALANFETAKQSLIDNNTLTVATLQAIPVNLSQFSTPLEQWVADYISDQLRQSGTGDSVSLTDWQNTINMIAGNEGDAARWKIGQVATNAAGHSASDITDHLLEVGIGSSFDATTALGAGVSKTASGFGGSTNIGGLTASPTASQIQTALLDYIGFTGNMYTAWLGNADRANFTLADFTACYDNNETQRSGGANACTPTATDWASASSVLTLFAEAKSDVANDETLSGAQIAAIGLDISRFGTTIPSWVYEYISGSVSATAANISDWQTTINGLDVNRTQARFGLATGYTLPTGLRIGTTQNPGSVTLAFNPNSGASIDNATISSATSSNCSLGTAGTATVNGQVVQTYPVSATTQGNCTLSVVSSAYGYPDHSEDFTFPIWPNAVNQADAVTVTASNDGERRYGQTINLTAGGGSGTGGYTFAVQSGGCSVSDSGQVTSSSTANCVIRVTREGDQQYNARYKDQSVIFHGDLVDLPKCDLQLASSSGTYNTNTGKPVYSSSFDHQQWAGKTSRYVASDGATLQYKVTDLRGDRCDDSFDGVNGIKMWWGWPSQYYCKFRIRKIDSNGIPTTNWTDEFIMQRGSGSYSRTAQAQLTAFNPSVEGSRERLEFTSGAWVKNDGTIKYDSIQGGSGTGATSIEGTTGACSASIPNASYPTNFQVVGNSSGDQCLVSIKKAEDSQYAAARTCADYFVGRPQTITWDLAEGILNNVQTYDLNNITVRRNGSVYNGPIEWFVVGPVFDTPEGPGCSVNGTTLTKVYNGRCRVAGRVRSDDTYVQGHDWVEIDTKDPDLPCRDTWGKFWTTDGTASAQTVCTVNRGHVMQCPAGSQPIYDGCVSEMNYCRDLQFTEANGEDIQYLYWGWDRGAPGTVRASYSSSTYDDPAHNTKTVRNFGNGYQQGHWAGANARSATLCAQVSPAFGTNNSFAE